MPMSFDGIHEAGVAIRKWLILNEAATPEHLQERFARLAEEPSPVVITAEFAEAVYANEGEFKKDAKDLAAAGAALCETFGFHGLNQGNRGILMARALAGEKVAKAKVPEPRADMQPPAPEEEEPSEMPAPKAAKARK